jgi:hypothetical protein
MKAYISCPIPVAKTSRDIVVTKLNDLGYSPTYWNRDAEYTEDELREADIFVLMSMHHKFDYLLDSMTFGCRKELMIAKGLGKPLYIAYWKNGTVLNIYPISLKHLENGRVLGESGVYLQPAERIINEYPIY